MIGHIAKDFVVMGRMIPNDQPYAGNMVQNTMRQNNFTHKPMGSSKLNGLYNTSNMPVVIASGGQKIGGITRQGGINNRSLALVMYPKRMPYNVIPK